MSVYLDGNEEAVDVWQDGYRKARKEHRCDACRERIAPGQTYHCHRDLFEGKWHTDKRCLRCQKIYEHLVEQHRGDADSVVAERLDCGHDYHEVFDCEPPPEIAALAFALPGEVEL